jgi:heme A synthase
VGLHLLHRWNAPLLVAVLLGLAVAARPAGPPLRRLAGAAAALGVCQLGVGVANVWLRLPVEVTGLHSALAAALVLTLAAAARQGWARPAPRAAPAPPSAAGAAEGPALPSAASAAEGPAPAPGRAREAGHELM